MQIFPVSVNSLTTQLITCLGSNNASYQNLKKSNRNLLVQKTFNMRQWEGYNSKMNRSRLDVYHRDMFDLNSVKKRGVSSNVRFQKSDLFNSFHLNNESELVNVQLNEGTVQNANRFHVSGSAFKTPGKREMIESLHHRTMFKSRDVDLFQRKRMSSFNENHRRPMNTLAVPK